MQDVDFQFARRASTWGGLSEVERIAVMEKRIVFVRWIATAVAIPTVPFLGLHNLPAIYGVIAYAALYSLVFQFYVLPYKKSWLSKSWLLTVGDLLMTSAIVYLTGGLHSDFYDIYFLLAVLSAIRFGGLAAVTSTILCMISYVIVVFLHGEQDWLHAGAVILLRMGFVGSTGVFVGYVGDKARQVEYELQRELDLAHAQVNESTALLNRDLDFGYVLQTAAEQARLLIDAEFSLIVASPLGDMQHLPPELLEEYTRPHVSLADARRVEEAAAKSDYLLKLFADLLRVSPMLRPARAERPWEREAQVTDLAADATLGGLVGYPEGTHVSLILVPLMSVDRELGTLYLLRHTGRADKLREAQKNAIEVFAARISAALTNSLVYTQSRLQAVTDPVTALYNYRFLHESIRSELAKALVDDKPLSLIVLDIDSFKLFNDTYGHSVGDVALKSVANVIRITLAGRGFAARFGGDEFVILLPDTTNGEACAIAEALRIAVVQYIHESTYEALSSLSISLGVACAPECGANAEELFQSADMALYLAKHEGKNKVKAAFDLKHVDTESTLKQVEENEMVRRLSVLPTSDMRHNGIELQTINALIVAVDVKDHYTYNHSRNVSAMAIALAKRLGASEQTAEVIRVGALLHDIGKIGVPDAVIQKDGRLSPEEFDAIKQHPLIGAHILEPLAALKMYIPIVTYHHEWWNGAGYPYGRAGEEIPWEARLVAVCDAFDAMTSDRPYQPAVSVERALSTIEAMRGLQFDPGIAAAFHAMTLERYATENLRVVNR